MKNHQILPGFVYYIFIYVDQGYLVKVNERVHGQNIQVTKHFYILDELWS